MTNAIITQTATNSFTDSSVVFVAIRVMFVFRLSAAVHEVLLFAVVKNATATSSVEYSVFT